MDQKDARAKYLIKLAESFRSRKLGTVRRRLNFGDDYEDEINENEYVIDMDPDQNLKEHANDLKKKYNFDFLQEEPLRDGKYEWEAVDPTNPETEEIPDFYLRPPHVKRPVRSRCLDDMLFTPGSTDHRSIETSTSTFTNLRSPCSSIHCISNTSTCEKSQEISRVTTIAAAVHTTTPSTVTRRLFIDEQDDVSKKDTDVCSNNKTSNGSIHSSNDTSTLPTPHERVCLGGLNLAENLSLFTDSIVAESDCMSESPPISEGSRSHNDDNQSNIRCSSFYASPMTSTVMEVDKQQALHINEANKDITNKAASFSETSVYKAASTSKNDISINIVNQGKTDYCAEAEIGEEAALKEMETEETSEIDLIKKKKVPTATLR